MIALGNGGTYYPSTPEAGQATEKQKHSVKSYDR